MIRFPPIPPTPREPRVIYKWDLRRLFNEGRYIAKIRREEIIPRTDRCRQIADDSPYISREIPRGSIYQFMNFQDSVSGRTVVYVHRYITPEGKLGGTGRRNDPKTMVFGNETLRVAERHEQFERLGNREINRLLNKRGLSALLTYFWWLYSLYRRLRFRVLNRYRMWRGLPRYSE